MFNKLKAKLKSGKFWRGLITAVIGALDVAAAWAVRNVTGMLRGFATVTHGFEAMATA